MSERWELADNESCELTESESCELTGSESCELTVSESCELTDSESCELTVQPCQCSSSGPPLGGVTNRYLNTLPERQIINRS